MATSLGDIKSEEFYQINLELLRHIKALETASKNQQNVIDDQDQEIKYLDNKISYLRKSSKCYGKNCEELGKKLNNLKLENVSLRVEGEVYQNKVNILNQNLEMLQINCDKLHDEIDDLHSQVEKITGNIQEFPLIFTSPNYRFQDPEFLNFDVKLCTCGAETMDKDEAEGTKLNSLVKMLSEYKSELEKKKICLLETEEQRKELEAELDSKMRHQQILDLAREGKKFKNELTANLRDEMREEDQLCENCFCNNLEDKETLKEEQQEIGEEQNLCRNCSRMERSNGIYRITVLKKTFLINFNVVHSTPAKRRCICKYFSKILASVRESFNLSNSKYWMELLEATSIVSKEGGEYYLSLKSKHESFPCDLVK